MKKLILGIIIGGIIFGTSVYAVTSYIYSSNEVSYTPSDSSWSVGNVKEALDNLKSTSGTALTDLKNTNIAKAVSANGSTLSSVINTLGTITNQGNKSFTISSAGSTTIPAGYYNGTGKITTSGLVKPSGTKSITSNGSNIDVSGYASVNVSVAPGNFKLLGTYTSNASIDVSSIKNKTFLVLCDSSNSVSAVNVTDYATVSTNYYPPSVSLSGNTLNIYVGYIREQVIGGNNYLRDNGTSSSRITTTILSTKVYYID